MIRMHREVDKLFNRCLEPFVISQLYITLMVRFGRIFIVSFISDLHEQFTAHFCMIEKRQRE